MADYRFARSPRWIATHLLVLAMVVGMVNLGLWQLRRLDERRHLNALVEANSLAAPVPVNEIVAPGQPAGDDLRFRAVTATGVFEGDHTGVRSIRRGEPGFVVIDSVRLDGDEELVVLRGFQPGGSLVAEPANGSALVEGLAVPIERLDRPTRVAIDDLGVPADRLLPVVVQATAAAEPLVPLPAPELDEGPHLAYAVQWFVFGTVGVVGYPFLLRREARRARD